MATATRTGSSTGRSCARARVSGTVALSLAILALTAGIQAVVFAVSGSVALLADLIHNFGDALTAIPLGVAFFLRSYRGEKLAGLFVVFTIFVSARVALFETIERFIHPQDLTHLWPLQPQASSALPATSWPPGCGCAAGADSRARRSSPTGTTRGSTASSRSGSSQALRSSGSACRSPIRSSASRSRS